MIEAMVPNEFCSITNSSKLYVAALITDWNGLDDELDANMRSLTLIGLPSMVIAYEPNGHIFYLYFIGI